MAEKIRSLNLTSSLGGGTSATLIGNPTLISSTLSTNHNLTPTVDLLAARDSSSPSALLNSNSIQNSDMESSAEFAPGQITAQLNFQLLPAVVDTTSGGGSGIIDYNSIMNSSQISAISHDSMPAATASSATAAQQQSSSSYTASAGNSMALVKAGAGKPVVAQSVAGVSRKQKLNF